MIFMASTTGFNDISGRNRYAGLISGLNTEDLVKAMTANTKSRINSQKQKLQTLQWKQESYRSIISQISDFKNKYLSVASDTSIKANKVMKKYNAVSSNDKIISATASTGATPAKYTIRQASSAKAASISSKGSVTTGEVKLNFSKAVNGKSYDVKMSLDGVEKTVTFKGAANTEDTKKNFLAAANAAFAEVKGRDKNFEFTEGTDNLKFSSNDDVFHTFKVGYNSEAVGIANDAYNKINAASSISSIGFKQALKETSDGKYAFNINGVDFEFSKGATVNSIINAVNESKAGVKLSFSNVSQSFTVESKNTGDASEVNIYQTKGNLLNSMFNIEEGKLGSTAADRAKAEYTVNGSATANLSTDFLNELKAGKGVLEFTFTDGTGKKTDVKIDVSKHISGSVDEDGTQIAMALYTGLKDAMGDKAPNVTPFTYNQKAGTLDINSSEFNIELKGAGVTSDGKNVNNQETRPVDAAHVPLSGVTEMTFNVGGNEVKVEASSAEGVSMDDLIKNGIIALPTDGNVVAGADLYAVDQNAKDFLNKIFGKTSVTGANADDIITARGSNSIIEVSSDGESFTKYSSATNMFTFDGTTINLSNAKDFKAESEADYITVETTKDNEGIKDVVKGFVEDYNKLLTDLYKEMNTSRPKSSGSYFDPLTEEQEKDMSDKEIEKWNENAKQGLLYRDSNIQRFLSDIRGVMSKGIDGFTLRDMGIKLTTRWQDNGKLEIDEAKLESAIEAMGDKVADFFTGENGLASRLENVVDKAISTTKSNNPTNKKNYGYLSQLAGIEGTKTDKDNSIYKQMEVINKNISKLNTKYANEQERYWKQYTRLEKLMSQMQSMQSYFTDGS